jgi:serine/threonine-protein kinase RIM15
VSARALVPRLDADGSAGDGNRTEPEDVAGTKITRMLAPTDWHVFADACRRLEQDDSHTVEVKFRMLVYPANDEAGELHFQPFEGKGMLMVDRETGQPSHTMWVVKPLGPPEDQSAAPALLDVEPLFEVDAAQRADHHEEDEDDGEARWPSFPFARPVNTQPIMCRICECAVPQWYFEKHNETCVEVHRLEAEIAECNESIAELRNTIRGLTASIERAPSPAAGVPEYRGMPILSPSSSPNQGSGSPLRYLGGRLQRLGIKRMQRRVLEQLEDILQLAAEVSVPALKEDEAREPIERQRLLSPSSERKMTQIRTWGRPATEDAALTQLLEDAERVMRQKLDNVVRMQNTIRYSEKVRQEWEERVMESLSTMGDLDEEEEEEGGAMSDGASEYSDQDEGGGDGGGYASSTKSEYAFGGDELEPSSEPTPLAVTPPTLAPTEVPTPSEPIPLAAPRPGPPPPPPPMPRPGVNLTTRSSTPSSVSSPLALVPPIVASPSPPPPINLDEGTLQISTADLRHYLPELYPQLQSAGGVARSYSQGDVRPSPDMASPPRHHHHRDDATSTRTVRTQKSSQSLQQAFEPRSMLTPPMSPLVSPRDLTTTRKDKAHRRQSTAHSVMSPTVGVAALSPRMLPPAPAPVSRTTPTSIRDFEIIKPISKGAFGSVFLAKKKATGDYFAIKVLKKADMIAKNQVTNVKAERMILMTQAESPFVAKLYFTFQSKENLYLVMEYLNGGDCAALIKTLGCLPEEWAKNYVAEVVLGLESLHQRGIVHR